MHHKLFWQLPKIVQKESYWLELLFGNYNTWLLSLYKLCSVQSWWPLMQIVSSSGLLICVHANQNLNKHTSILLPPYLQSTTIMEISTSKSIAMPRSTTTLANIQNYQHTKLLWTCDISLKWCLHRFHTNKLLGNLVIISRISNCFAHCMFKSCPIKWGKQVECFAWNNWF